MTLRRPGGPTQADVARRAGVSRALVSLVLRGGEHVRDDKRQAVAAAMADLGYRAHTGAQLLSRRRSRLLGVTFGLGYEFHAELVTRLYDAAAGHGYDLALSGITAHRTEARALDELQSLRADALLLTGSGLPAAELAALAAGVPTVLLSRSSSAPGLDVVRTDDVRGARLATEHLLGLGHRRILHVDGGRAPGAAERRRGYRAAMRAAGLAAEIRIEPGGVTEEDGGAAGRRLLARDPAAVTAAVVFNDPCALGFLDTLRRAGHGVPGDLAVVGYDDSHLARAGWAQLTTVAQNTGVLAQAAVERAVGRIEGRPPAAPVLVRPALVVRATTGPPRSGR